MQSFPLQWPVSWQRTKNPKRSRFGSSQNKPSIAYASDIILAELKRLTGSSEDIIISSNLKYKNNGVPYSGQKEPTDQGVAVYFMMEKEQIVIACDSFDKIGCNLYAIGKTIEAMRSIDRWGCSELLKRAFTGFKALPMPAQQNWWEVLKCSEASDVVIVKSCYRQLVKKYHPDNQDTGNVQLFQEVQFAWDNCPHSK